MDLNAYRAWLQQRERSAGTIEKYLRDTARFFRGDRRARRPAQRGRRRLAGRPGPPRLLRRQRQRHAWPPSTATRSSAARRKPRPGRSSASGGSFATQGGN